MGFSDEFMLGFLGPEKYSMYSQEQKREAFKEKWDKISDMIGSGYGEEGSARLEGAIMKLFTDAGATAQEKQYMKEMIDEIKSTESASKRTAAINQSLYGRQDPNAGPEGGMLREGEKIPLASSDYAPKGMTEQEAQGYGRAKDISQAVQRFTGAGYSPTGVDLQTFASSIPTQKEPTRIESLKELIEEEKYKQAQLATAEKRNKAFSGEQKPIGTVELRRFQQLAEEEGQRRPQEPGKRPTEPGWIQRMWPGNQLEQYQKDLENWQKEKLDYFIAANEPSYFGRAFKLAQQNPGMSENEILSQSGIDKQRFYNTISNLTFNDSLDFTDQTDPTKLIINNKINVAHPKVSEALNAGNTIEDIVNMILGLNIGQ